MIHQQKKEVKVTAVHNDKVVASGASPKKYKYYCCRVGRRMFAYYQLAGK